MSSIAAAPSTAFYGNHSFPPASRSNQDVASSLQAQSTAALSPFASPSLAADTIRRPPSTRPATGVSSRSNRPATAASVTTSQPPSGICAVIETRGIGREVGIAVMDSDTGRVTLCQLADTQTYIKTVQHLSLTGVAVLLAPGNASTVSGSSPFPGERSHNPASNHNSVLLQCVQEAFGVNPTYIHRRHWNEKEGAAYIERLIAPDTETATALASEQKTSDTASSRTNVSAPRTQTSSDILSGKVTGTAALTAASSKYYALSAACALFRYLESADNTSFRPSSLMIEYRCPEGVLFIGADTVRALELLENNLNRKSKQCMFGLMNFCATPMAERLLRMNLLQPLTDRDTIESRHDAVEEMVQSEVSLMGIVPRNVQYSARFCTQERYASINQSLKPLGQNKIDADKLISQVCMSERTDLRNAAQVESKIAKVLALRTFVRSIRPARHALDGCSSGLLRAVRMFLDSDELDEIAEAVETCINDDMLEGKVKMGKSGLAARTARLYAVKSHRNALLDVARETYKENIKDIYDLSSELSETHNLPLTLKFATTGFVFELRKDQVQSQRDLPRVFVNVVKGRSKSLTMSTLELKKRNQRMLDSMNEVLLLSDQTVEELRQEITERVGSLFKASEAIAILDMLASFAHLATVQNCVRPELTNSLVVSNGRHPILARFPTQKLVGNDIYASEGKSFTMINGPNMSGKSTYLQQIALLVIMASVGSFVPADYASFPTYDAILTCECRADNLAQQLSSFAAEMRATSFILSAATTQSLVLIDELGRATSTSEGFGFSYAVAEHLLNSGTTTFWATHLTELNVVLSKHFNFCHRTFQVDVSKRGKEVSMEFHHRIIDGEMSHPKLGLELARLAGVPKQVCETACKLAAELRESEERQRAKSKANAVLQRRKIIMKLDALLRQTLDVSRLPPKDLRRFLARIQDEATDELYETYTDGESKEAESASLQGCGDGEAMDECPDLTHESG
ncbi:MutS protein msh4 [Tilletia horrida]|nr:MutS protein msh4 [Tilletia horrida]